MRTGILKPDEYIPRLYDSALSEMLDIFDAVEVAGTMWCGKTWTSLAFGNSVTRVGQAAVKRSIEADPSIALLGDKPHVIDEWQDVPAIWDEVRNAVDAHAQSKGSYILTGSSSPSKDKVNHSGAGRIAKMRMRTMTLQEMGISSGTISLEGLFEGQFEPCAIHQSLEPLAEVICRGGWPALIDSTTKKASRYIDSYFDAIFETSIPKRGLNGATARLIATSLARNLGSTAKLTTIGADALPGQRARNTVEKTVSEYLAAFEALYLVENVGGWDAPIRSKSRLRTKPKRYFADASLPANLLRMTPKRLLDDGQLFGMLFEALCMHDLAVYASVIPQVPPTPLYYYRDSDGLEVDAIIEMRDGRWGAFEIKLGENKVTEGETSLLRLKEKIALNPQARNKEPEFLAVLVGAGTFARKLESGIYVIPITALGA